MTTDVYPDAFWDDCDVLRPAAEWEFEPTPDPDRPVDLTDEGYEVAR